LIVSLYVAPVLLNAVDVSALYRRGSRLHIRHSRTSDAGLYQCRASNLVGQSHLANATVSVTPPGE